MYTATRWFILVAFLSCYTQLAYADEPASFTLSPSQCVMNEEVCEVEVTLSWHLDVNHLLCLKIISDQPQVLCDLPAHQAELKLTIKSAASVKFLLTSLDQLRTLKEVKLMILFAPKRKPRRRPAWSIFK